MSFDPNFETSQSAASLDTFTITDTSTGSDNTLTGRLIYCRKYNGATLVPDGTTTTFIAWPLANTSQDIADILDKDYALDITVYWFAGSTIKYTKAIVSLFTGYGQVFMAQLTQALDV